MKSFNKIISIILCIALLMSFSTVLAAVEEEPIYGEGTQGLINALGIAEYTSDNLAEPITRGEFYKMASLAGMYPPATLNAGRFADVAPDHPYAGYIAILADMNIIAPSSYGKIYPDGNISVTDAACIMVKILGYSLKAEAIGKNQTGYISLVNDLKLLSGMKLKGDEVLNKGMAMQLIYNTLDTRVLVSTYGDSYTLTQGGTLLEETFKVNKISGVLKSVDISRLVGENDVKPFHIEIGGKSIECRTASDIYSYLGYNVDVYYEYDMQAGIDKLIYIQKNSGNEEISVDAADVVSVSGTKVKYVDEKGKIKTLTVENGAPVVYNGTSTKENFKFSMVDGKLGKVRFLSTAGGTADVVFVDVYKNYIVSYVDSSSCTMYNEIDVTDKVVLDTTVNDPYTVIYNSDGQECRLSKIKTDMIVSVYQSAPDAYQQYIRAYINGNVIEGQIDSVKNNEIIVLGDEEYRVSSAAQTAYASRMTPGAFVKLYFDISGFVVKIENTAAPDMMYAYVIAMGTDPGLDQTPKIKMYTQTNEFLVLSLAKKIKLDGKMYDSDDATVLTRMHTASEKMFDDNISATTYASVIRYALNNDGELNVIDTILKSDTLDLTKRTDDTVFGDELFTASATGARYFSSRRTLGPKLSFMPAINLMLYASPLDASADLHDENKYIMTTPDSTMINDKSYDVHAFYTNKKMLMSEFIAIANKDSVFNTMAETKQFAMVDHVSQGLNSRGESVDVLNVISKDGKSAVFVKPGFTFSLTQAIVDKDTHGDLKTTMTVKDLKLGDVIKFTTDIYGDIIRIDMQYHTLHDISIADMTSYSFSSASSLRKGYVYDKFEDGYLVYYTNGTNVPKTDLASITEDDCEIVLTVYGSPTYFRYGTDFREGAGVEVMSKDAIKSYKDTGLDCSEIVIQQNYGTPLAVLIIDK